MIFLLFVLFRIGGGRSYYLRLVTLNFSSIFLTRQATPKNGWSTFRKIWRLTESIRGPFGTSLPLSFFRAFRLKFTCFRYCLLTSRLYRRDASSFYSAQGRVRFCASISTPRTRESSWRSFSARSVTPSLPSCLRLASCILVGPLRCCFDILMMPSNISSTACSGRRAPEWNYLPAGHAW